MDSKQMLLSALGVGVGVGVGLGLASGQAVGKWATGNSTSSNAVTADKMEKEILRQVVDGRESKITFDEFPYYLSEQTRVLLTSAAYVHLKHFDASKYTRNLSPASRAILLSGPAELYQQMLAKALAHFFDAKLLLLDVNDFALKIQSKYGSGNTESSSFKRSPSESALEQLSGLFSSFSILPQREEPKAGGTLRRQSSGMDIKSSPMEGSSNPSKLRRNSSAANISNLASSSNSGVENREKILKTLLAKEEVDENLDYKELSMMTEGYTGSDLKNLCTTAAYRPVRELIQQERIKDTEKKKQREATKTSEDDEGKEERIITLRPLNRQDFKEAKNQVAASFAAEGAGMGELKQWNELYGEGGSRKKEQLTYFL